MFASLAIRLLCECMAVCQGERELSPMTWCVPVLMEAQRMD